MEEIIPISASDASLLAPEELYEPKKETKAAEELSREEKKTKRRDKKRKRNKQRKQKDAEFQRKLKLNPELAQAGSKSLKGAMEKIKRSKVPFPSSFSPSDSLPNCFLLSSTTM